VNTIFRLLFLTISKVINDGLIIIKNVDKAKDLTRDIVNNLQKETDEIISTSLIRTIMILGIAVILIIIVTVYFIYLISVPVYKIKSTIESMSRGEQVSNFIVKSKDEFGEIQNAINKLILSLKQIAVFAKEIGNNNFKLDYTPANKNDVLGNSLLDMKNNLKEAEDKQQIRDTEDEKRKWTNEGIALFSDVLRQNENNLEEMSANILIKLVDYLNANQGGLFIKNDDEKDHVFYELITSYAYNRRKYKHKIIELGEGIVGTCALEKKIKYLTDIPEDYIKITSGLGGANPKSILIVPLKIEEDVLGIIEIASFNEFKKYEIEFVNEIAGNIASTLSSVRVNTRTKELLEKTQQQAEEMSAQEEEMRQNMEELQATQEEAGRKSSEMEGFINALNLTSYIVEYDLDGRITYINDAYLNLFGINRKDAIGSHHSNNLKFTAEQKKKYQEFWQDLKSGKTKREKTKIAINDKTYIFLESYSPIYDDEGTIYKILKIANDISEFIKN
jgi:methyl-accepting chemotaxis protein